MYGKISNTRSIVGIFVAPWEGYYIIMYCYTTGILVRIKQRPMSLLWLLIYTVYIVINCASRVYADDMQTNSSSQRVKDTILHILSYSQWSPQKSIIKLCIIKPTVYSDALVLDSTLISMNHSITVTQLAKKDLVRNTDCDVIYIQVNTLADVKLLTQRLANGPVLIISEQDAFDCTTVTAFCLKILPDRIAFNINLDALARSGVRVHPNVLKLSLSSKDTR